MKRTNGERYEYRPGGWQLDPATITTDRVQVWRGGVMVTAIMPLCAARVMIQERRAFAISRQAIGAMDGNGFAIDF